MVFVDQHIKNVLFLDRTMPFNICVGIVRGPIYLHEYLQPCIIHRDIKASSILLDKDLNPKIANFGLAQLFWEDINHLSIVHIVGRMYIFPLIKTKIWCCNDSMTRCTHLGHLKIIEWLIFDTIETKLSTHFAHKFIYFLLVLFCFSCRGYLSPEDSILGKLAKKVDVFSYGVLFLEIVGGRKNIDLSLETNKIYLLEWVSVCTFNFYKKIN